jgi:alkanesulfonate monooxygenase SsuD/methylene tetrahydromethanopterin reductase-like flavin-dependent oxidoreductase (luciferase family)
VSERFEWLEETLQIAKQMWSGEVGSFEGKHFKLAETLSSPQPISKPHPPIMIGGMGEKKTLRLVAQYADACNLFIYPGMDVLRHKLDVLKGHCEDVGRPYDDVEKTVLATANLAETTPDDVVATCRELAEMGFEHAIFNMPNVHEIKPLEAFGEEIIPAAADL